MRKLAAVALAPLFVACSCGDVALEGAAGDVAWEPAALDFGPVFLGERATQAVTLTNGGRGEVTLAPGAVPAGFSVEPAGVTIAPGGRGIVQITFEPAVLGEAGGALVLAADGAVNEVAIGVRGLGVERAVEVVDALDFGPVPVGTPKTLPLRLTSSSAVHMTARLVLDGQDADDFHLAQEELALAPRDTGAFEITFTPRVRGAHAARGTLTLCDGCPSVTVMLRGDGAVTQLQPRPPELYFGLVSPGSSRTLSTALQNTGDLPVAIGSAGLVDGSGAAYSVDTSALPGEVAAGGSLELPVTFAPAELGDQGGTLRVFDPAGVAMLDVPLVGRGGGATLVAAPSALDFGLQIPGVEARRTVTVTNVGEPEAVQVYGVRVDGARQDSYDVTTAAAIPADVGASPLAVEVVFLASDVADHPAELVFLTSDPDQPEVKVPIAARTADLPPCSLEARPSSLRFGLVHAGEPHTRTLTLANVGFEDCLAWDFVVDPAGSPDFSLVAAPAGAQVVPANGAFELTVKYAPPLPRNAVDRTTLGFSVSNPAAPHVTVPVSGYASAAQLIAEPAHLDFGRSPQGYGGVRSFDLRNTGPTAVQLDHQGFAATSSADYSVLAGPLLPQLAGPGASLTYQLRYQPFEPGADTAEFEVWVFGAPEPVVVTMVGEGTGEECGDRCLGPTAACPNAQTVTVNNPVSLQGAGVDPTGDPTSCTWRVIQAPVGSRAQPQPPASCTTSFVPDMVGDYLLELTVMDPQGNAATCQTRLTANAYGGLWVEMWWSQNNDIDLHLLHPGGGGPAVAASWLLAPWDCYFSNMQPSWDGAGAQDDPSLDRDDTVFTGPENIRINQPDTGHAYSIGLHYWADHNGYGPIDVTTNLYCGGAVVSTTVTQLLNERDLVVIGDVQFNANGGCSFAPGGMTLSR